MILPLFNDPPHGLLGRLIFHRHRPLFPSPTKEQQIIFFREFVLYQRSDARIDDFSSSTFPFPHESPRNGRLYSFVFYYRSDVNIYDFSPPSSTFPFPHELRRNSRLYFKFIHQIHITDSFENLCFISVQMQGSTTFHRPLFPSLTNHEGTADYILSRIRVLLAFRCKYRRLFTAIIHFSFPPRITKEQQIIFFGEFVFYQLIQMQGSVNYDWTERKRYGLITCFAFVGISDEDGLHSLEFISFYFLFRICSNRR